MGLLSELKTAGISGTTALEYLKRGGRPITSYGDIAVDDGATGVNVGRNPEDVPPLVCVGHGRIVDAGPSSEANYQDARYWVHLTHALAGTGAPDSALNLVRFAVASPGQANPDILPVTNLPELAKANTDAGEAVNGCHLLDLDTKVLVFVTQDEAGTDRYYIIERPDPLSVRLVNDGGFDGGIYTGFALTRPTADVDGSADLTQADLGDDGATVIILNPGEVGQSTHRLTAGTYMARLVRVNDDGTPVVQVVQTQPDALFPVTVASDGGANGTSSGAPTYTYAVARNAVNIGNTMTPQVPRPYGSVTTATYGTAYYDSTNTLQLFQVFELPSTYECT